MINYFKKIFCLYFSEKRSSEEDCEKKFEKIEYLECKIYREPKHFTFSKEDIEEYEEECEKFRRLELARQKYIKKKQMKEQKNYLKFKRY